MEAVKVRVQTRPGFARGLNDGLPKFVMAEGTLGLFKGLVPLWGRQIPYTMVKFASFENIVEIMYKYAIPTPKEQCGKPLQLGAVKKLGLFTSGLPLRIAMIGTLTGAQWLIYDSFKVFVGL
ncbi:hypothetical protein HPP92_005617 [Vanilla planifolia]|uniref:Uncharacterized protein n=1 Tax=Vanilla planifolia TaxID=51239 RepID=A0A835RQ15_VANPL|nr:hypothetical protein HPP92_005617 [Vanilla planifolia]